MAFSNIEIKAGTSRATEIRKWLLDHGADYRGTDWQVDTYFNVPQGRLKLRQGNIENSLIYYERTDDAGPKHADFSLAKVVDGAAMKEALSRSLGIKVVVEKQREIYYIGNVKFHIDTVAGLGNFVEIEAGNMHAALLLDELRDQCRFYMEQFGITETELVSVSYSDLIMKSAASIPSPRREG